MQLLLIRHGDAGDRDADRWPDDTLRPLTDRGRKEHRRMARRLRRRDLVPQLLLSSPWLRAWQTAQVTAEATGSPAPVVCEPLAGAPEVARIAAAIGSSDGLEIVGLVGHEPWLSELASLLLVGDPHRLPVDLPKSGVIGLELEQVVEGGAVLEYLWRPKRR